MRFLVVLSLSVLLWSCQARLDRAKDIVRSSMCAPRGVDALAELDGPVPLFVGLGKLDFPITTSSDSARMYF